jgi:tryptophan-rich sensory protein
VPTEHWQADFSDSRQVYQGSRLPAWLLAGWATFIIWALVYLYFGLSKF